jgi:predicted HAD superfamily phosphohydrolase
MKVLTIDSEVYRALAKKIDRVFDYVKRQAEREMASASTPDPAEVWVDNDEAASLLEVSKRTLQRLRSGGEITYSIRWGRVRYTLAEVQRLIAGRVVASKYRQEADLLAAHQEYRERRKATQQPKNKR